MTINRNSLSTWIVLFTTMVVNSFAYVQELTAQTRQLPITYYTDRVSASRSGVSTWIDPVTFNVLQIDALGRQNISYGLNLPTTVAGGVNITTLANGTERATVEVDTSNAICWGRTFNADLGFVPAFGFRPSSVAAGLGPAALGTIRLHLVFAPQPAGDLNTAGILDSFRATILCDGVMRGASGFVEGSPGRAQTTQVALFNTGVPSGCPMEHDADCFPAEKVQFIPTGH